MGVSKSTGRARNRVTLRDVAAAAGVDVSTVSKVLNKNGQISVRPETRQRILDEAERLRYRPDPVARSLRNRSTGALAMVFPDLTNPVYAHIMRGAARRADELGYAILLAELAEDGSPSSYQRLVTEHRIDGFVIATSRDSGEIVETLPLEAPHVYVNRQAHKDEQAQSVTVDDEAAGRMAATALLDAGHTRLAFLGDSDQTDTARRRRRGFFAACEEAGVPAPVDKVIPYTRAGGYEATVELLGATPPPTAIFASSLLVGIGTLAAAHDSGKSVPGDLSVVTLDAEDANYTVPPLTAVRLPLREMGEAAIELIDRVLKGEPTASYAVPVPPELVERNSIGPPAEVAAGA